MSEWRTSVTPIQPPFEARPHTSDLVYAALVTGIWSGVACLLAYGVGRLLGVPFEVIRPGSPDLSTVPWLLMLIAPVVAALLGALAAALLLGRRHAGRIAFWAGTLIALASLASPLLQPDSVLWSTRLWLVVTHLLTWLLVVPQIARIVGDSEPGAVAPPPSPA